jgi:hypothetical protein
MVRRIGTVFLQQAYCVVLLGSSVFCFLINLEAERRNLGASEESERRDWTKYEGTPVLLLTGFFAAG